jgi:hypothetical protein
MTDQKNKRLPFIIGSSYLLSFIAIRLMVIIAGSVKNETVIAIKEGAIPSKLYIGRNIIVYGYHIHHFYFGILLLSIAGWMAIVGNEYFSKEKLAIMYGIGLGLFMDEIGMLLSEGNYYSSLSYLLGVLLLGILINIIYFPPFWKSVRETIVNINIPGIKIIKTLFSYLIKTLDFISTKIVKYKVQILVIIIIFFIIDFLIPYLF